MSGQKRLERAIKNNRVVAIPTKKRTDPINGEVQLYKIKKMR